MNPVYIVALVLVWLVTVIFFGHYRIWILFYLVGSVGLAFILIFLGRMLYLETGLENVVTLAVHNVCNWVGVPTRIFQASPGSLLVMVIGQDIGWTVLQVTIECSGLLEISVMLGMVLFYPGLSLRKRAILAAIGSAATFVANIIRLFFIVEILHYAGKNSIFISHTIAGRAIFFFIVVAIYWFVLTRPMLKDVRNRLEKAAAA
jgi:exosortase family protein XrtG